MECSVRICCGTACYIMGGSDLLTIDDYLTDEEKQSVQVIAVPCLNQCKRGDDTRPPFAMVNDTLIDRANVEKLLTVLRKKD